MEVLVKLVDTVKFCIYEMKIFLLVCVASKNQQNLRKMFCDVLIMVSYQVHNKEVLRTMSLYFKWLPKLDFAPRD